MTEDRNQFIEAMEKEYKFPGFYPITLIAKSDLKFFAHLSAALEYEQDGKDFEISERPSKKKNYISYRISVFVNSADEALKRKEFLRGLDGVLLML
jgi:putative lipoic acid-binding regulatory protein